MASVAWCAPTVVGTKRTRTVHELPSGKVLRAHVPPAKLLASVPTSATYLSDRTLAPVFVIVTDFLAFDEPTLTLPKVSEAGATVYEASTPAPLRGTDCETPPAVTFSAATLLPTLVGSKVAFVRQRSVGCTQPWQTFGNWKSVAAGIDKLTELTQIGTVPVFNTATPSVPPVVIV
jgi:hypothetical protein